MKQNRGRIEIVKVFGGAGGTTRVAFCKGLSTGGNFDLTTSVNLLQASERHALLAFIHEVKPLCVVMGPPCTAFGSWSRYNRLVANEAWLSSLKIGLPLARVAADIANIQHDAGRFFICENPQSSQLWLLPEFVRLRQRKGILLATADQCQYGLTDPAGVPTMKPTSFLCNHPCLANRLMRRCKDDHVHAHLQGSVNGQARCKYAQTWPRQLCEAIVAGILDLRHRYVREVHQAYAGAVAAPARTCPGCISHAFRGDSRHTREVGVCKFPTDSTVPLQCQAC